MSRYVKDLHTAMLHAQPTSGQVWLNQGFCFAHTPSTVCFQNCFEPADCETETGSTLRVGSTCGDVSLTNGDTITLCAYTGRSRGRWGWGRRVSGTPVHWGWGRRVSSTPVHWGWGRRVSSTPVHWGWGRRVSGTPEKWGQKVHEEHNGRLGRKPN